MWCNYFGSMWIITKSCHGWIGKSHELILVSENRWETLVIKDISYEEHMDLVCWWTQQER